jgi:hypothetical protein
MAERRCVLNRRKTSNNRKYYIQGMVVGITLTMAFEHSYRAPDSVSCLGALKRTTIATPSRKPGPTSNHRRQKHPRSPCALDQKRCHSEGKSGPAQTPSLRGRRRCRRGAPAPAAGGSRGWHVTDRTWHRGHWASAGLGCGYPARRVTFIYSARTATVPTRTAAVPARTAVAVRTLQLPPEIQIRSRLSGAKHGQKSKNTDQSHGVDYRPLELPTTKE